MIHTATQFLQDETGTTAVEYGLIAVLVSIAAILGFSALGTSLLGMYDDIVADLAAVFGIE